MIRSPAGERSLEEEIAERIRAYGELPFPAFMSLAMQHPTRGYYARGSARLGRSGDFITSPEISSAFGECLALQIREMDRLLGQGRFTIVELGAGSGRLAEDVLDAIDRDDRSSRSSDLGSRLTYVLVERSERMRAEQRERLRGRVDAARIAWAESIEEAARIMGGAIEGVVYSNEFFDALPVHAVVRRDGRLHEKHVGLGPDGLIETSRPVEDPAILEYARAYGVAPEEGMEAEIGLEAVRQIRGIARMLARGFHVIVDYGHEAAELYSPLHPRGTMLAYSGHRTNEEFLERIGDQDITAHVNFSALIDEARSGSLETAGLTTQDRFLLAFGLADRIVALAGSTDPGSIRKRLALASLIHPEGMGRTFKVLIQCKGIAKPRLTGLRDVYRETSGVAERSDE